MAEIVPRHIDDSEVIMRFAYEGDYRRKRPFIEENIIGRELFFDNRYEFYPVSVLRKRYASGEQCLKLGSVIQSNLKSLVAFKKSDFEIAIKKNREVRKDFAADIVGTPLDENWNYIAEQVEVTTDTPGNPAHADIRITNPGIIPADDENANTAVRGFSSVLFKLCKVVTLTEDMDGETAYEKLDKFYDPS